MTKNRPGKRPQPSGWSEAVQQRLRPEHVKRISDTQVEITLPPCPDFDIEEDEVVHVWIPPAALTNATEPLYAGAFTIKADTYTERIRHAIKGMNDELRALPENAELPRFLLMFFACEIIAKSLVSMKINEGTATKSLSKKWSTKQISASLKHFGIDHDSKQIEILFSEKKAPASDMSARSLRDNIVHRMKSVHRDAVRARFGEFMLRMESFLDAVEDWMR